MWCLQRGDKRFPQRQRNSSGRAQSTFRCAGTILQETVLLFFSPFVYEDVSSFPSPSLGDQLPVGRPLLRGGLAASTCLKSQLLAPFQPRQITQIQARLLPTDHHLEALRVQSSIMNNTVKAWLPRILCYSRQS